MSAQTHEERLRAAYSMITPGKAVYPLARDGVFWTVQGEGALIGEPMVFVRFAGCSVGCPQCDTDYRVHRRVELGALVQEIQQAVPERFTWPWVWLTGGEPTDHNLTPLIDALKEAKCRVALATSGKRVVSDELNWLSVSPHTPDVAQRSGHELKVVPGLNGLSWADVENFSRWSFPWRYVQPLGWGNVNGTFTGVNQENESLVACLEFVRTHPGWRMGIQAHKYWSVP